MSPLSKSVLLVLVVAAFAIIPSLAACDDDVHKSNNCKKAPKEHDNVCNYSLTSVCVKSSTADNDHDPSTQEPPKHQPSNTLLENAQELDGHEHDHDHDDDDDNDHDDDHDDDHNHDHDHDHDQDHHVHPKKKRPPTEEPPKHQPGKTLLENAQEFDSHGHDQDHNHDHDHDHNHDHDHDRDHDHDHHGHPNKKRPPTEEPPKHQPGKNALDFDKIPRKLKPSRGPHQKKHHHTGHGPSHQP